MENIIQYGKILLELRILLEKNNIDILGNPEFAGFCGFFSRKNFQQGGLACSVFSDQSDFVARFDVEGNIVKKWFYSVRLTKVLSRYIMHAAKIIEK
jgi:hypothetical protein